MLLYSQNYLYFCKRNCQHDSKSVLAIDHSCARKILSYQTYFSQPLSSKRTYLALFLVHHTLRKLLYLISIVIPASLASLNKHHDWSLFIVKVDFTSTEWIIHLVKAIILKTEHKLSLQHVGESLRTQFKLSSSNHLAIRHALYIVLLSLNLWDITHLTEITFWSSSSTWSYAFVWSNQLIHLL